MLDVEDVLLAVYDAFRRRALAPTPAELAVTVGAQADEVRGALVALHESRDVVLRARGDDVQIVMADPFAEYFREVGLHGPFWGLPD